MQNQAFIARLCISIEMWPMRRRDFICLLGTGAALLRLTSARAGQKGMRHIGFLSANAETDFQTHQFLDAFQEAMRQSGWVDGDNIRIDYRWGAADLDRLGRFARELVSLKPDLIIGHTTPATAALQRETKVIPIVFVVVSDPVGSGFVSSLSHPGSNATGFVNLEASMASKWIEFVKEVTPQVKRMAVVFNPDTAPLSYFRPAIETAARSQLVELLEVPLTTPTRSKPVSGA